MLSLPLPIQQFFMFLFPLLSTRHGNTHIVRDLRLCLTRPLNSHLSHRRTTSVVSTQQFCCDRKRLRLTSHHHTHVKGIIHLLPLPLTALRTAAFSLARLLADRYLRLQGLRHEVLRNVLQMRLHTKQLLRRGVLQELQLLRVVLKMHLQLAAVERLASQLHHARLLDQVARDASLHVLHTIHHDHLSSRPVRERLDLLDVERQALRHWVTVARRVVLLNLRENGAVCSTAGSHEGERRAEVLCAGRTADAMDVVIHGEGHTVVDHSRDICPLRTTPTLTLEINTATHIVVVLLNGF